MVIKAYTNQIDTESPSEKHLKPDLLRPLDRSTPTSLAPKPPYRRRVWSDVGVSVCMERPMGTRDEPGSLGGGRETQTRASARSVLQRDRGDGSVRETRRELLACPRPRVQIQTVQVDVLRVLSIKHTLVSDVWYIPTRQQWCG